MNKGDIEQKGLVEVWWKLHIDSFDVVNLWKERKIKKYQYCQKVVFYFVVNTYWKAKRWGK